MADHAAIAADEPLHRRLLQRPGWLLGYFGLWTLLGLWQGSESVISLSGALHPPAHWEPYVWELSSTSVISVLALAIAGLENRFRVTGAAWLKRLPIHAAAAVLFSIVHVTLMEWLRTLAYAAMGRSYHIGDPVDVFFFEFQRDLSTYALIVLAWALSRTVRERHGQQLRELELRKAVADARFAHLTAQIEPHFIFNTLNTISNRMYEDVSAADRMLVALADLLRAAMMRDGAERVRVAEEQRWLEAYCHLMTERQPGRLQVDIRIDPAAGDALLPRLLLQPLVENAFRHGLREGRGRLEVEVRVAGSRLHCRVADDGAGFDVTATTGLGLANVRERLALLYPDDHRLQLDAAAGGGGTEVTVDMPLERADAAATGDR